MNNAFKFELIYQSKKSRARVGRIHTPHGIIDTPSFVAVGTNATVKALDSQSLETAGQQLIFCNTYHLLVQPGTAVIKQAGGLHTFMNRRRPIITDSGGFQVFSLAYGSVHDELKSRGAKKTRNAIIRINEEGVLFRSYRDGSPLMLTPESSVQAQKDLGADIIIPLDELPPYHVDATALRTSLDRTHRWEKRSLDEHRANTAQQAMYAVIHGGVDPELRSLSTRYLTNLPFDGFAIGGSFGKTHEHMLDMLAPLMPQLPSDYPSHLLGMGDLKSVKPIISLGVDTFDSSYPTRCARHGMLFTKTGACKITHACNKLRFEPIEHDCTCYTCQHYTAAYLHHLFKAHELTAYQLASMHNVHFMVQLMQHYREQILINAL